jgi:hypothetical protein
LYRARTKELSTEKRIAEDHYPVILIRETDHLMVMRASVKNAGAAIEISKFCGIFSAISYFLNFISSIISLGHVYNARSTVLMVGTIYSLYGPWKYVPLKNIEE